MIHGLRLLEAAKQAGQLLAIVAAGLKIGDVHLRLDRARDGAEFIFRAKVGDKMIGAQFEVALSELCILTDGSIETVAHAILAKFDRISRGG